MLTEINNIHLEESKYRILSIKRPLRSLLLLALLPAFMRGSIPHVTIPPRAYLRGFDIFFLFGGLFPASSTNKETIPRPRDSYLPRVCMCTKKSGNIGCCTISKTDVLSRTQRFSRVFIERRILRREVFLLHL